MDHPSQRLPASSPGQRYSKTMTDLTQALETRLGPAPAWPIKVKAACAQLDTMRKLMGDDYPLFLYLARQAIEKHQEAKNHVGFDRRRHLGLLLYPEGPISQTDTLKVGWAINYSLELLLDDSEYEAVIKSAIEATQPDINIP